MAVDEVAFAKFGRAGDAELGRERLELRELRGAGRRGLALECADVWTSVTTVVSFRLRDAVMPLEDASRFDRSARMLGTMDRGSRCATRVARMRTS